MRSFAQFTEPERYLMSPYRDIAIVKQEPTQVKLPNEWDMPVSYKDCLTKNKHSPEDRVFHDDVKLFYDKDLDIYYCKQCKEWKFFIKEFDRTYMHSSSDIKTLVSSRNKKVNKVKRELFYKKCIPYVKALGLILYLLSWIAAIWASFAPHLSQDTGNLLALYIIASPAFALIIAKSLCEDEDSADRYCHQFRIY